MILLLALSCGKGKAKMSAPEERMFQVKKGVISKKVMESGICQPKSVVKVMSKISGELARYVVNEGESVKKGQEIFFIYPDISEIQRINGIKKNYALSKKDFETVSNEYDSYKDMLPKGFVSRNEFDETEKNYIAAKIAYENAKIEMEYLSDVKERTFSGKFVYSVSATAAGTFYGKTVEEGEFIKSAMENMSAGTVIGYIGDLKTLEIMIDVDEVDIPFIKQGQRCEISFDAMPQMKVNGEVIFISLNAVTKNVFNQFTVKVGINDNPAGAIKPGMSANVNIVLFETPDVLIIPLAAVFWEQGRPYVRMQGKKAKTEVKLGKSDTLHFEVLEGLSEGDTVLYTPSQNIPGGFMMRIR